MVNTKVSMLKEVKFMNRRQAKKASKKVIFPMGDEMNLLTLIPEEYEKTMKDFYHYVQKYCCYKHY